MEVSYLFLLLLIIFCLHGECIISLFIITFLLPYFNLCLFTSIFVCICLYDYQFIYLFIYLTYFIYLIVFLLESEPLCDLPYTDHVIVIAGWGIDKATNTKYWIGRNSYGGQWGEGSEGGWFRLERGVDALNMESHNCSFAVPAKADVDAANNRFYSSVVV